jgi:hypothetical protein
MTANDRWLTAGRSEACRLGVELRECLLATFMEMDGLRERPLILDVLEDLVQDGQRARLRDEVLPLDRYTQSEVVNGRILVTLDKRIAVMPGVKNPAGVRIVAIGHEAAHVDQHLDQPRFTLTSNSRCPA